MGIEYYNIALSNFLMGKTYKIELKEQGIVVGIPTATSKVNSNNPKIKIDTDNGLLVVQNDDIISMEIVES